MGQANYELTVMTEMNAFERESRIFVGFPIKAFGHDDNDKWYF